jgi:hypothetical protein
MRHQPWVQRAVSKAKAALWDACCVTESNEVADVFKLMGPFEVTVMEHLV